MFNATLAMVIFLKQYHYIDFVIAIITIELSRVSVLCRDICL